MAGGEHTAMLADLPLHRVLDPAAFLLSRDHTHFSVLFLSPQQQS